MCGQGHGASRGSKGVLQMGHGCSPGRREFKSPASQPAWTLAWPTTALGSITPYSLPGSRTHSFLREPPSSSLGLLPLLPGGVELGIGPWRTGCQPCVTWGGSVGLLRPSGLTAEFRVRTRRSQVPWGPHGGQLLATVLPNAGLVSGGGRWAQAGLLVTCPFPLATP